jgi:hypothetical protein
MPSESPDPGPSQIARPTIEYERLTRSPRTFAQFLDDQFDLDIPLFVFIVVSTLTTSFLIYVAVFIAE